MIEKLQSVKCVQCGDKFDVALNGANPYNLTTKPFICANCIDSYSHTISFEDEYQCNLCFEQICCASDHASECPRSIERRDSESWCDEHYDEDISGLLSEDGRRNYCSDGCYNEGEENYEESIREERQLRHYQRTGRIGY